MRVVARILLIDDDARILAATKSILEAAGYEVKIANSPFGAGNAVRRENPDVVVMDVMMPGLDGKSLARLVRNRSDVPIIFYSAMDEEGLYRIARRTEHATHVCKSEGVDALLDAIGRVLEPAE